MKTIRFGASKKGVLIALAIFVVLLGGGGGYLLWRVNQQDTVAPTDSDASEKHCACRPGSCHEGTTHCSNNASGTETCVGCGGYDGIELYCHIDDYECSYTFTLKYIVNGSGSITGETEQTVGEGGSGKAVTAVPNSGHKFVKWTDGKTTPTRTDSNVQADATYIANFVALGSYTLKYETDVPGTLEGTVTQTVQEGKDGTAIKVNNKGLMIFKKWSDGKTDNPRIDKAVNADLTVKAVFESSCGNNVCDSNENAKTCPKDCPAKCPDGFCTHDETAATCPQDCPVNCGDKICSNGEDANNCPKDCVCGDGICSVGEDASTCPEDCNAICGDGLCTSGESSATCPQDCGSVPSTGLFDDSRNIVILGSVLLLLGMTWTWVSTLPKRVHTAFSTVSSSVLEYVADVKQKKVRSERESRRSRLERRIK